MHSLVMLETLVLPWDKDPMGTCTEWSSPFFLKDHALSDVTVLCKYVHLQKLDLSHNKINGMQSLFF